MSSQGRRRRRALATLLLTPLAFGLGIMGIVAILVGIVMMVQAAGPVTCGGEVMHPGDSQLCIGGGHFGSYEEMAERQRTQARKVPYLFAFGAIALLISIPTSRKLMASAEETSWDDGSPPMPQ